MRNYRYYVYETQEDLDACLPSFTGSITASSRLAAENQVSEMYPGSYYLYCVL